VFGLGFFLQKFGLYLRFSVVGTSTIISYAENRFCVDKSVNNFEVFGE